MKKQPTPEQALRWWICERCSRAKTTILVQASSKKEAQAKLDSGEGEGVDTSHYQIERAKVIRRDRSTLPKL